MHRGVPAWEGSRRHSVRHRTAAKREVLGTDEHGGESGEGMERVRRESATDSQTYLPPQEAESQVGEIQLPPAKSHGSPRLEMISILWHIHTYVVGPM